MQEQIIDTRSLTDTDKEAAIIQQYEKLEKGAELVAVFDKSPERLVRRLLIEGADHFRFSFIENGPELWQIRIQRRVTTGSCCSFCGS